MFCGYTSPHSTTKIKEMVFHARDNNMKFLSLKSNTDNEEEEEENSIFSACIEHETPTNDVSFRWWCTVNIFYVSNILSYAQFKQHADLNAQTYTQIYSM